MSILGNAHVAVSNLGPFYNTFHPGPKEETELSGTLQANLIKQRSGTSKILKTDRAVPTLQSYFKSALCFTIQVYFEVYGVLMCRQTVRSAYCPGTIQKTKINTLIADVFSLIKCSVH